jgi:hypothetical protein
VRADRVRRIYIYICKHWPFLSFSDTETFLVVILVLLKKLIELHYDDESTLVLFILFY